MPRLGHGHRPGAGQTRATPSDWRLSPSRTPLIPPRLSPPTAASTAVIICADTTSNDPVELAGVIARDRAEVVATGAVGLSFPRKVYYEKEISFINSRSYGPGPLRPILRRERHGLPHRLRALDGGAQLRVRA
ncbi:MAG: hypothetical protein MZV64_62630 [Ignavibacteriales bacterium]|nr:hypothetical protein [Ignavibacteriales bacterium]